MHLDFESARKRVEGSIPFVARAGLKALELSRGHAKCLMPLLGNQNHIATMYAGALFTLAEIAGGALFVATFDTGRYFAIVLEMNIQFVKPADSAITVEVRIDEERIAALQEEAQRNGKARFELLGELKSESGVVVARSRGLYQMRKVPEPAA